MVGKRASPTLIDRLRGAAGKTKAAELEGVRVVHSWEISRAYVREPTPRRKKLADAPPMSASTGAHNSGTGKKALFMGEHAAYFEGQPVEIGSARLEKTSAHAVEGTFRLRHKWTAAKC
jgi:hypothetical protein